MSCCKCYDKLGQIIINDTVLATNALLLITKSISFDDTSLITSYKLFRNIKRTFCFRWARNRKHTNKCSKKVSIRKLSTYHTRLIVCGREYIIFDQKRKEYYIETMMWTEVISMCENQTMYNSLWNRICPSTTVNESLYQWHICANI